MYKDVICRNNNKRMDGGVKGQHFYMLLKLSWINSNLIVMKLSIVLPMVTTKKKVKKNAQKKKMRLKSKFYTRK